MNPIRIQRKRSKGWRMPPNTVNCTRPSALGNPFTIENALESGFVETKEQAQKFVVDCFGDWQQGGRQGRDWWQGRESDKRRQMILRLIPDLKGMDLACWCREGEPCHADMLLRLANEH